MPPTARKNISAFPGLYPDVRTLVVIPARFASIRFPGKPLARIGGKAMVQHVWERSVQSGVERVIIATEDERIIAAGKSFGAEVEMTRADHASGTDRMAEVSARHPEYEIVINVQGDEPGMAAETIAAVAQAAAEQSCDVATAVSRQVTEGDLANPNVVKVVLASDHRALYFSRSPIPYVRNNDGIIQPEYLRHLGIYGFRRASLMKATALPPSPLEQAESLEQLRWLQAGFSIYCVDVPNVSVGIDTPADLQSFEHSLHA
jgi:3-deoxy-manno-octulosonate cytidylyltransferase (CMP-KDO synthetase)